MPTVIVMEDDDVVRGLIVQVLQMDGYEVQAFPDAGPALESADFSRADLVITDLAMPTSGEEAIRRLRKRGIQVPILVVSGHIDEDKAGYLKQLGAQEVVRKPFKLLEFLEAVRSLI
jgi:DNA-binding response OmpR family regulator